MNSFEKSSQDIFNGFNQICLTQIWKTHLICCFWKVLSHVNWSKYFCFSYSTKLQQNNYLVKFTFTDTALISFAKSVFHWQFLTTYIFSVSLKFLACFIRRQWDEVTVHFLSIFLIFIKRLCFYFYISFFDELSNFYNIILTNQEPEQIIRNCQWNWM